MFSPGQIRSPGRIGPAAPRVGRSPHSVRFSNIGVSPNVSLRYLGRLLTYVATRFQSGRQKIRIVVRLSNRVVVRLSNRIVVRLSNQDSLIVYSN